MNITRAAGLPLRSLKTAVRPVIAGHCRHAAASVMIDSKTRCFSASLSPLLVAHRAFVIVEVQEINFTFLCFQSSVDFFPINHVPPRAQILGATIAISQIVSVLPYVVA